MYIQYMYTLSLISITITLDVEDSRAFASFGTNEDGYIGDLDLNLTEDDNCDDSTDTSSCQNVYYVCVKAENGAGQLSEVVCSSPIKVVDQDQKGKFKNQTVTVKHYLCIKLCFISC